MRRADVAPGQIVAVGAAQAFGVQDEDEFVVRRLGIEEMRDGEVHRKAYVTRLAARPCPDCTRHRPFDLTVLTPQWTWANILGIPLTIHEE